MPFEEEGNKERLDILFFVSKTRLSTFSLSTPLCHFEQCLRIFHRNHEQRAGGSGWRAASLFPILQSAHRHTEQLGKAGLGKPGLLPEEHDGHAARRLL